MMISTSTTKGQRPAFDTDSYRIGVDNRTLACISHKVTDFDGPLEETNQFIKGITGARVT